MASPPLTYKRNRASQPISCEATLLAADGQTETVMDLTDKTIEVILVAGDTFQTLVEGAGVDVLVPLQGKWQFTMTAARMAALGTPKFIETFINFYAADGQLFSEAYEKVRVSH
jgi:hypothetical protein